MSVAIPPENQTETEIGIKSVDKKSSFVDIYTDIRPLSYYNHCDKLNYGKSHNGFNRFSSKTLKDYITTMKSANKTINLIDIGCSYGNSTMSIIDNLNWQQVGSFWEHNTLELKNKNDFHVIGCDVSQNALNYGYKRGYFDEIFTLNVNDAYSLEMRNNIIKADILCVYMIFCYFENSNFQKLIDLFLSDRSKEKYIFYNFTPAFQHMSVIKHTPEHYIAKHLNCEINLSFSMHRNFTDEEKRNFDKECIGNESYNFIFSIKCMPVNDKKNKNSMSIARKREFKINYSSFIPVFVCIVCLSFLFRYFIL